MNKTVNRGIKNKSKLLIYIRKVVVGGTGLEPVPRVSYLVIKFHKVSYSLGYHGHMWSYLVISFHTLSYEKWHRGTGLQPVPAIGFAHI